MESQAHVLRDQEHQVSRERLNRTELCVMVLFPPPRKPDGERAGTEEGRAPLTRMFPCSLRGGLGALGSGGPQSLDAGDGYLQKG